MHPVDDPVELRAGPVRDLFEALNEAGVAYVVLRGYLPLTELESSVDIDVYVAREDLERAAEAVGRVGWLRRRVQDGKYPHVFFDHLGHDGRFAIVFDVVTGLNYGSNLDDLRNPSRVIDRSSTVGGVRVPDPWHAAFLLALHLLLDKGGTLRPHHDERVHAHRALCAEAGSGAANLAYDFGEDAQALTEQFLEAVADGRLAETLDQLTARARRLDCLKARPLWARVHDLWTRIRRRLRRPVRVGLIGVDGSGKSTIAERFRSSAMMLPVGLDYLGYNQFRSAWFRWLIEKTESLQGPEGSNGPIGVRALDLVKEALWPLEVRHRMRRTERGRVIVLYDRFPLRDPEPLPPGSFPRRCASLVASVFDRLLPPADIVLLMDGDAQTLWERKKEYPLDVLVATQKRYRAMIAGASCETYVIRTDCDPEESLAEVLHVLSTSPVLKNTLYRST